MSIERYRFLPRLVVCLLLAGCRAGDAPYPGADPERALEAGEEFAAQLIAAGLARQAPPDEQVIALGYLERLQRGLGGPFRLIDHALRDPRLDIETRRRLGWALLERTRERQAYRIEPTALDRVGSFGRDALPGIGRYHLALIEDAVAQARDPRSGELLVRLAYALAAAEGSVSRDAPRLAAQAAALIRDRELARADVRRLMRAAQRADPDLDPLALVPVWRGERRFEVERPPVLPLSGEAEQRALELAPRLAVAIRSLGPRLGLVAVPPPPDTAAVPDSALAAAAAPSAAPLAAAADSVAADTAAVAAPRTPEPPRLAPSPRLRPLLGRAAAIRLAQLADSLDMPPRAPVLVSIEVHRSDLLGAASLPRSARERFADAATDEERFAAELALLSHTPQPSFGAPARVALRVAVALRALAQEEPWFPGVPGPSAPQLEERFGLSVVRFGADVPEHWRPFYRRMLQRSLADLQRVLPTLDLRGLSVEFGGARARPGALASHLPSTRTLYLPPRTGSGAIAHEIAHDLDWQIALQRYRVRGDYGTDRVVRNGAGPLATAVRGLSAEELAPPIPGEGGRPMHARRPAEVFARGIDWLVVVSLAREGRSNGYLSSAQDDLLTGYGTLQPPDVTGRAGAALVSILDQLAPLYPETRSWFLELYGPSRTLPPYDLIRQVLADLPHTRDADIDAVNAPAAADTAGDPFSLRPPDFSRVRRLRALAIAALERPACVAPGRRVGPGTASLRHELVAEAAGARARGLLLRYVEAAAGPAAQSWAARRLYGAHWPARPLEPELAAALGPWVEEARSLAQVEVPEPRPGFDLAGALPAAETGAGPCG